MKAEEMRIMAEKLLLGKRVVAIKMNPTDTYCDEAKELTLLLQDGTKIEIGASWNEDGELHLCEVLA